MKAPTPLPPELRLIERHTFLASVDAELRGTLRERIESPGVHLLAIFTDPAERYAEVLSVGPEGDSADLRTAAGLSLTGLGLRYVVPCQHCPAFAVPKGYATTGLPLSLLKLLPPPVVPTRVQRVAAPVPPARPSLRMGAEPVKTAPSFVLTARARDTDSVAPAVEVASGATPTALLDRAIALDAREAELDLRETALVARERRQTEIRRDMEEEAVRLNEDLAVREDALVRREQELRVQSDALLRALRELDALRASAEALANRIHTPSGG